MLVLDQDALDRATREMCEAAQVPVQILTEAALKDMREQVTAFVLALNKNYEREKTYKGLWKQDTIEELGQHLVHKGKRMSAHNEHMGAQGWFPGSSVEAAHNDATDDAIDVINYGAFIARKVHYSASDNGMEMNKS